MTETSSQFQIHTLETAPQGSRPAMQRLLDTVGMIPNLAAVMSASPVLLQGFVTLRESIGRDGTFTAAESEAISLANAVENGCAYCTAIHATFALGAGVSAQAVEAIRSGGLPEDASLAAKVAFARALIRQRGRVTAQELSAFLNSGGTIEQAFEMIARSALSLMANFSGRMSRPSPDAAIEPQYRPLEAAE